MPPAGPLLLAVGGGGGAGESVTELHTREDNDVSVHAASDGGAAVWRARGRV
eukprot:gene22327-17912_t